MQIKEFYAELGGDYSGTLTRLMNERLMNKFIKKFPGDGSYAMLCDAIGAGDWETAFRGAHTLKGVCANLGFTKLQTASSELTEAMRGGKPLTDFALFEAVKAEYAVTLDAIGKLE